MLKMIRLAKNLALAIEKFVTGTQLIVAQKRSGKSYAAMVQAEDLLEAKQQVVVIDPTSAWWGLRSSADGKRPGYAITIFGGKHGDAPLDIHAGKKMAQAVVDGGFSAIFDLSKYEESDWATFCADFLGELYRLNTEAVHLFIDEADVCAPQSPGSAEQHRALRAANSIIRRGGIKGIGCTLITQRAALINKDLASQVDQLVILRMNHHLDIESTARWVSKRTVDPVAREEMIDALPSLPVGDAYVWNPTQKVFERIRIRPKRTFDSGRTPKAGERKVQPKALAKVDAAKLSAEIAASIERAKESDPKALRAELVALRAELERAKAAKQAAPGKDRVVEKKIEYVKPADLRRMEAFVKKTEKVIARIAVIEERFGLELSGLRVEVTTMKECVNRVTRAHSGGLSIAVAMPGVVDKSKAKALVAAEVKAHSRPVERAPKPPAPSDGSGPTLAKLEPSDVKFLSAIAWWNSIGIAAPTLRAISFIAGASAKSSSFVNRRSKLRTMGLISYPATNAVALTDAGRAHAAAEDPPTLAALHAKIRAALDPADIKMLDVLIAARPNSVALEDLAKGCGASAASSSFINRRSMLRSLGLADYPSSGHVAASDLLFPPGLS